MQRAILSLTAVFTLVCFPIPANLGADDAADYVRRGVELYEKGEYGAAIKNYNRAIHLRPDYAEAYYNRGLAQMPIDDFDKAIADFDQAIRLKPDYGYAYKLRGFAWAMKGELKKAVADGDQARHLLGGKQAALLCQLAAVLAEEAQFDKAVEWQTQAVELLAKDKYTTDKDKQEARSRLELYKQRKPYRDEAKKK